MNPIINFSAWVLPLASMLVFAGPSPVGARPMGSLGRRSEPSMSQEPSENGAGHELLAERVAAQTEIVSRLDAVSRDQADFFIQLELSIARQTFTDMQAGAAAMLDETGGVITTHLDWFHNQLDEFQRALVQLDSGPLLGRSDYGHAANEAARAIKKPMKLSELQRRGESMSKELRAIEKLANETPGLEELDSDRKIESVPEFVEHVHRVAARIEVLTDRRMGLGPHKFSERLSPRARQVPLGEGRFSSTDLESRESAPRPAREKRVRHHHTRLCAASTKRDPLEPQRV